MGRDHWLWLWLSVDAAYLGVAWKQTEVLHTVDKEEGIRFKSVVGLVANSANYGVYASLQSDEDMQFVEL